MGDGAGHAVYHLDRVCGAGDRGLGRDGPGAYARRIGMGSALVDRDDGDGGAFSVTAGKTTANSVTGGLVEITSGQASSTTVAMGGHVRGGLEDSLWLGPGKLAETNASQVAKVREILEGLSFEVATPDEARQMLGLKGADQVGF